MCQAAHTYHSTKSRRVTNFIASSLTRDRSGLINDRLCTVVVDLLTYTKPIDIDIDIDNVIHSFTSYYI